MTQPSRAGGGAQYRDEGGGGYSQAPQASPLSRVMPIIISAGLAFGLVFVWFNNTVQPSLVSKKDFTANLQNVATDLGTVKSGITTLQGSVGSISTISSQISQVGGQITTVSSDVANLKSSLASYATKDNYNQLNTSINSLSTSVEALKTQIADIQTRVKTLEDKATTPVTPTNTSTTGITAKVKTISNLLVTTSNTTMTGAIRIELTNTTASDVSDIVLDIGILTDTIQGYQSSSMAGAGTIWQGQGIPWNTMDFMNTQWGLNLAASEKKVIYLTYTVTGTGFWPLYQTYGVPFQVTVEVI